jgi:hypothetical protein
LPALLVDWRLHDVMVPYAFDKLELRELEEDRVAKERELQALEEEERRLDEEEEAQRGRGRRRAAGAASEERARS